jgi:hypothetical protein
VIGHTSEDDFAAAVLYRLAYGLAADLIEIRRYDHAGGRAFASGVGADPGAIPAEVLGRLDLAEQGGAAEVVREAVEAALAGRRPRW